MSFATTQIAKYEALANQAAMNLQTAAANSVGAIYALDAVKSELKKLGLEVSKEPNLVKTGHGNDWEENDTFQFDVTAVPTNKKFKFAKTRKTAATKADKIKAALSMSTAYINSVGVNEFSLIDSERVLITVWVKRAN